MKRTVHGAALAICAAATLALAGCGGGGEGDPNKLPADTASRGIEGIWSSNMNQGAAADYATQMIVLNDGSLWGTYGTRNATVYTRSGVLHGHASSRDGSLVSASYQKYDMADPKNIIKGSFSGSLVDRSRLSLTLGNGMPLQLGYNNSYDQPVSLDVRSARSLPEMNTGLVTLWSPNFWGQRVVDQGNTWIGISGSILTTNTRLPSSDFMQNCTISGILVPRGEVGVFDTQLTFRGGSCKAGNGVTYSGIIYSLNNRRNFEIIATTPDGQNAFYFLGLN